MSNLDFTSAEIPQALPSAESLANAEASIVTSLLDAGLGFEHVKKHLLNDIAPGFTGSSRCPNYYAFTTGAVTDAALFADWLASTYDQNVQVHLPKETIATGVEDTALRLLQQLLSFSEVDFPGRLFTTGATASNLLGMAVGREFVVAEAGRRNSPPVHASISQLGLLEACLQARVQNIQVLSTLPHSSLYKAASAVGIGRNSVVSLPLNIDEPWRFDMAALEQHLSNGAASIISISAGEVSSGRFATDGQEIAKIRALADKHGAWIHVDGAFGLQARILPQTEAYSALTDGVSGLHLADSITGDAHKLLNVPYDCGFFFTRHLALQQTVFSNPNSAYLSTTALSIPSPLNLGVENSRRFRALPVYASLLAYGRVWHCDLLERQIALARRVAAYIANSTAYELLPNDELDKVYIVVLFRARMRSLNTQLGSLLNASKKIHVSELQWMGQPATRIAVGTWRVDVERDFRVLVEALEAASGDTAWGQRR
ncbi:pyridoxal phosphate-dependent transferase [Mycena belliarum]|uniref:Pyridoxal phosphate-dependent transferase n=1 Tax=Mycena belliarum TaxID=1033014 RepID=A0AAD6U0F8_9AGAR|nr:pyridoxal phosphate-dependent transferase [Mycena belliae]